MRTVLDIVAVGVVAMVVSAVPARCAELEAGAHEASFSGTFESAQGSGSALQITGDLGFLLTRHHEVGPTASLYQVGGGGWSTQTGGSAGAFYRYNFATKAPKQVPFLGFRIQRALGDYDLFRDQFEADAGIRFLPVPAVSVNVTGFYRRNSGGWEGANRSSGGVTVGISFFY
jgi:hypothetical protein